jgi:NlpC/P60 family putative phage cell wall peptidase
VPTYTPDWAEARGEETLAEGARRHLVEIEPAAAQEGDLVLFRWRAHLPAKHAAILSGAKHMIHAQQGAAVAEVPLSPWWRRRIGFAFEFPARVRSSAEVSDKTRDASPIPSPQGQGNRM